MNLRIYKNCLAYCGIAAALVLNACNQNESAQPAKVILTEQFRHMAETMDKLDVAEADREKVWGQYKGLGFEEMEALIDARYKANIEVHKAPEGYALYLREFRHRLNRKAYELYQKPFQQLESDKFDAVMQIVNGKPGTGSVLAAPGGKVASDCGRATPVCTVFTPTTSVIINNTNGEPDTWATATYMGERTIKCSDNTYQDDCDYLFQYRYYKIWAPAYVRTLGGAGFPSSLAARLIDENPDKIDCGYYRLNVIVGKKTLIVNYLYPENAAANLKLGLIESIQTGLCYRGTWGSEKWYYAGIYKPEYDNWGANNQNWGYYQCECNPNYRWVR